MKNELAMSLISRQHLTEELARKQITALCEFDGGLVRPDKWSQYEPVKTSFNAGDINEPVNVLAQPQGHFFYRRGRPIVVEGGMWNLALPLDSRFTSPRFTNY